MSTRPGHDSLHAGFRWRIPDRFNMGVACADRHPPAALALVEVAGDGSRHEHTFGDLSRLSNRLANALAGIGVGAGDRVAVVLPQRLETGLAHLAISKLGAIAMPLSGLFGFDALRYRIGDSGARVVIADAARLEVVAAVARELDGVTVLSADAAAPGCRALSDLMAEASDALTPAATTPDTPALLIYTSGTTGAPKGALHGQRVLLGHLPGFELSHDFFPQQADLFWTPADWAWIGGLMDALMPSWYHGRPVLCARRERFDPEWALRLMADERVRNVFFPPTALKLIRQSAAGGAQPRLRTVASGGESLGDEILEWARERLGVTVNEFYGQTEANLVVGNCSAAWEVRPGSMGRPYPGHDVTVLGEDGSPAATGVMGEIAVRAPDPVMFLEYWNRPDATRQKFTESGEWLLTGDLASVDGDGYLWYAGRNDDVINSAGYRIGPAEIEACLTAHPSVVMAAAVGVPDAVRGEAVKAFVVAAPGCQPSPELEQDIRAHVKSRLAAYLYPRHFEFVEDLPMTTTGKIRRAELRERS